MTSTGPSPASEGPEGPDGPKDTSKDEPKAMPKDGTAGAAAGDVADDGRTVYADRVFRSGANVFWGVLLLAVAVWLAVDAIVRSDARTAWTVLAGLALAVPLVVAFLVRPAVYANDDRLRIRNPFRTIVLPWAVVDAVRTGYSSEVLAGGAKYQLWAVPVSLRQRKKAVRNQARAAAADDPKLGRTPFGRPSASASGRGGDSQLAASDQTIRDLQELAETNASRPAAQGKASVRWAYEVIAPCVLGLIALITLLAI
jgi:hypothetical protein